MMKQLQFLTKNLFSRRRADAELTDELRFHMEMQTEYFLKQGMSREEAVRRANLEIGGVEQTKELCRQNRAGFFWDTLLQDIRYARRSLFREPIFLVVAVLSLALGIGANATIFSVTRAVLLKPLPYPHPERVLTLWGREKSGDISNTNYATFVDWKETLRSFEALSAMSSWQPVLSGHGEPAILDGMSVSAEFFKVIGVSPFLGRAFTQQEDRPGRNKVVILSYGLWKRYFNGDPAMIGRQIFLSGTPRTVVGVMPSHFQSVLSYEGSEVEIYRPLGYDSSLPWACRTCNHLQVIGRVLPGITDMQASQDLDAVTRALIAKYPDDYGIAGAAAIPLQERFVSDVRPVLLILFAAVSIVLLIACANIANLMVARASRRGQEIAIRLALGAGQARLIRQMLTESLLLAFAGGAAGVLLAVVLKSLLLEYSPFAIPRLSTVQIDFAVLFFALIASVFSGMLFGLAPVVQIKRLQIQESLQRNSANISTGNSTLRSIFVAFNIALALVLLTSAGLLFQSIRNLLDQKLGFQADHVVTMTVSAVGPRYADSKEIHAFYEEVLTRVRALPGIETVGLVSQLPLSPNRDFYGIRAKDKPVNPAQQPSAERYAVNANYFRTLKIPILAGRAFTEADQADSKPVVLINERLAAKIWKNENPIGKQIQIGDLNSPWRTVVGIAQEVRHQGLDQPFGAQFYMPYQQWDDNSLSLLVRSKYDAAAVVPEIRKAIAGVDATQPVSDIATMKRVVESNVAQRAAALKLVELFALLAVVLAAMGVYGVMAYNVTRRLTEIGIRIALGAGVRNIVLLLSRNGLQIAVTGILFGAMVSLLSSRFLQSLLFHVKPQDPLTLLMVCLILLLVASGASIVPAIRAIRSNPLRLLRQT